MAICRLADMTCIAPSAYRSPPAAPSLRETATSFDFCLPPGRDALLPARPVRMIPGSLLVPACKGKLGTTMVPQFLHNFSSPRSQSLESLWPSARRLALPEAGRVAYCDLERAM